MARKKAFKAESKRLMDLMINSIYTHKEIFLRELISNASDAIDKLYYKSLSEKLSDVNRDEFRIDIALDKNERTITISDNGIGMSKAELEENLGTIAKSGSFDFKENNETDEDVDIIGQFGVGFYSSFMVADKVEVISKQYGSDEAYRWYSETSDGYEINKIDKDTNGTIITLYLKENTDDENYDEYLESPTIQRLIRKYSDYIRYPIYMDVEESRKKEDSDEYETIVENKVLNSMVPLWKRNKSEISEDEYNNFYMDKFQDYNPPLKVIHTNVEGTVSFNALLFIPSKAPMNYYSNDYEKGLQLYSSGVFILDKASELIPEHFRFVRGLVDSQDLSLNISREMLQHDRQLRVIASRIEKKIKSELLKMLRTEREKYEEFWNTFGMQIKYGVYNEFGAHKELLQDLLMFYSSKENKLVTLDEYVNRMPEDQKEIYFISGDSIDKIDKLPQVELLKNKEYEVLYLTDDVDEFALQVLGTYKEKQFKNISQGDLDLASDEEKEKVEQTAKDNEDLLKVIKEALKDEVDDVKISTRLVSHPVVLSAADGMSFEMEKVLSQMPNANPTGMKASRILEINPNHELFKALQNVYANNKEELTDYAQILYDQALLMEGFQIKDPIEYANKIAKLMVKANS
ncbi:molecular chaperone HtpG [Breznakia sp. PF5-3]|uniref:molecular chaperone HtpG n=1 Tax=unclassified Breznakia TaxID=2623764 RepID=UPI002406C32A|nr:MULTISPECIES: molecular chaperone HtpG [unclassified Breznakia]MDF9824199.1 molecular chaperone HtpG [Breznakia sp. PM6-1]MDF9834997.1 molecular chaperone HtpG [Breznakia sp. PF5-3]MDF9837242.1 molecular chaperone HtpG [Breznakia sp. PFB2-8]MDF9859232.1 molecular chaperone HtpG [Breznakia sp. PH5-24]